MNIKEEISNNSEYIVLGLMVFSIILLILFVVSLIKISKLNKKYKEFMTGATGKNLESQILKRFSEIDGIKEDSKRINLEINKILENLQITYQKVGVIKYDAFKEMGGKLSFVLALLDKKNNGILLNSVHSSREGCYTYLKEIIKGESFLELSGDERKALNQALNSNNYYE